MTKAVRIENACTNTSKTIIIEQWQKKYNHDNGEETLVLVSTRELDHPTFMDVFYLHDSNYLIIKEKDNKD